MSADNNNQDTQQHRIKSFVRRTGRVTVAQQRALDEYWPEFGLNYEPSLLDLNAIFGRTANHILEIGFGNGELLATTATANPQANYIGVEVHESGVGHCLLRLHEQSLTNVRLIRHDAIDVLTRQIPDHALHGVNLFFPDPWPKKRQHKRRIVRPDFIALLGRKIEVGGYFHVATDWANYAEHIDEILTADPGFCASTVNPSERPETKFELRGKKLGHEIWEQIYTRL